MSIVALQLNENQWTLWLPETEHPLFHDFKLLQVQSLEANYEVQKKLLNKLCDKRDKGFVATYMVVQDNETGQIRTSTSWTDGITSWLPRTDMIRFARVLDIERGICDRRVYD